MLGKFLCTRADQLCEKKVEGPHKPSQVLHGQALLENLIYNEYKCRNEYTPLKAPCHNQVNM